MRCREKLQEYLAQNGVSFEIEQHRVAYTAQDMAAVEHVPGRKVAKVVVGMSEGEPVMLVLPANVRVDWERVKDQLGLPSIRMAREDEFAAVFPDCEIGAMPPFGNLYSIPVYVDESLSRSPEITFPAGSHTESIRISYSDFEKLAQPAVKDFGSKARAY